MACIAFGDKGPGLEHLFSHYPLNKGVLNEMFFLIFGNSSIAVGGL